MTELSPMARRNLVERRLETDILVSDHSTRCVCPARVE